MNGSELRFQFKGKSGKVWRLKVKDRRIAKIVRACQDLPGQELFQYIDEDGERRDVTSSDVNAYLREITGRDVTAKDFRTWQGTVLAAIALQEFESFDTKAALKKNVKAAIERVASRLGNTPTICRKCYVHPEVLSAYAEGQLLLQVKAEVESELSREPRRSAPGRGRGADLPRSPPEAHAQGQARRQRRAARGRQGRGKDREESLRPQAQIRRPEEAAREGAVGGSRRLNRPPAGGGAFPERRAGS